MQFFSYLFVPLVLFLAIVLPLWMTFHYVTKWKLMKQNAPGTDRVSIDPQELRRLRDTAERLEQRIRSLEKILDQDSPDWRER
ncbi:MAG: envelope stress response membrane protein PspB [Ectothiorhodospiraceae bacterium]|jgi:phage shock protein B